MVLRQSFSLLRHVMMHIVIQIFSLLTPCLKTQRSAEGSVRQPLEGAHRRCELCALVTHPWYFFLLSLRAHARILMLRTYDSSPHRTCFKWETIALRRSDSNSVTRTHTSYYAYTYMHHTCANTRITTRTSIRTHAHVLTPSVSTYIGHLLASASNDHTVKLWDLFRTKSCLVTLAMHAGKITEQQHLARTHSGANGQMTNH